MTQADGGGALLAGTRQALPAPETSVSAAEPIQWLRRNAVVVTALLLIGLQLWWKAGLLGHSFFRLDDFNIIERASAYGLSWKYLMWVNAGHLMPLGLAIGWILVRLSPYDWALASAVTLVLLAATCLALLRLLRTLFGNHPGILVPLLVYLVSPLSFAGLSWWVVTLELLPLQLAMFCAVTAHVKYLRTGRLAYALATGGWLLVGMASSLKGAFVPLLLFALTSAFFTSGRWSRGVLIALREHWRVWAGYLALMAGYAALYLSQLSTSTVQPGTPGTFSSVFAMASDLLRDTLVPGAFGGPWHWFGGQGNAVANPPAGLLQVSWVLGAAVIIVSLWNRLQAWRAWLILAFWLVVADIIPVALGQRTSFLPGALSGHETRYVWDTVAVLAICSGLAFLPMAGEEGVRPRSRYSLTTQHVRSLIACLATALLIGSVWSFQGFEAATTSASGRSYIATARLALAGAPAGTVIVDDPVPQAAFGGLFVGPPSQASAVLAPLQRARAAPAAFIAQPHGTFNHLLEFDGWGRLVPSDIVGAANKPLAAGLSCWPAVDNVITIPLSSTPLNPTTLRIGYLSGGAGEISVTYAGQSQLYKSARGINAGYLPVQGSGSVIIVKLVSGIRPCIGDAEVGVLLPSGSGPAIPLYAVSG
jgi:hypothetical protein